MADTSNLSQFLSDVADAIRTKKETTEQIPAENFDTEIASINTLKSEEVIINPTTSVQVVEPSEGKNAITKVTVEAVTSDIDNNIVAENIKSGVTILGVDGSFEGGTQLPDGVFIQEAEPTKTTEEAIWLKKETIDIPHTQLSTDNLVSRVFNLLETAINSLSQDEKNTFNSCDHHIFYKSSSSPLEYSFMAYNGTNVYITRMISENECMVGRRSSNSPAYLITTGYSGLRVFNGVSSNFAGIPLDSLIVSDVNLEYNGEIKISDNSGLYVTHVSTENGIHIIVGGISYIVHQSKSRANTFTKILDTSNADATAEDILEGKTAFVNNTKLTGTIPNNGELNITPGKEPQTIPTGYTSGGTVSGDTNLLPENIKSGITIFGVEGTAETGGTSEDLQEQLDNQDLIIQQLEQALENKTASGEDLPYSELFALASSIMETGIEDDSETADFTVDDEMVCLQKGLKILKGVA